MSRLRRIVPVAGAVALLALAGVGCSDDTSEEEAVAARAFEARVERLIARSIEPQLEANLGEGSTVEVDCAPGDESALRCEADLVPGGDPSNPMTVVYGVDCTDEGDSDTCRWTPIG